MEQDKRAAATLRLLKIMDELREKCPWDRKQTFETLRGNTIEETYELADAILDRNMEGIREELGDLMLHIVFYSKLGAEAGAFDYADMVDGLCDKLIYRHPHVYGDIHADTPDDVKRNWEAKTSGRKSAKRRRKSRPKCAAAITKRWKGSSATSSSRWSTPAGSTESIPKPHSNAPTASSSAASPRWRKPPPDRGVCSPI